MTPTQLLASAAAEFVGALLILVAPAVLIIGALQILDRFKKL